MSEYELTTIIVMFGTAVTAGIFSWRSNRIASRSRREAEEANRTAHEAKEIARESNRIAEQANGRIESLERDKIEHERSAIVTIAPDESALTMHGSMDDYYPFQISNIWKIKSERCQSAMVDDVFSRTRPPHETPVV